VPRDLPSVFFRALGKEALCRVLNKKHSAKKHLAKKLLCRVQKNTRQRPSLPSAKKHSAKKLLCRVPKKTLGKEGLCRVFFFHSAMQFFKAHFEALNEFKFKSF
jgi:hypothetical protein